MVDVLNYKGCVLSSSPLLCKHMAKIDGVCLTSLLGKLSPVRVPCISALQTKCKVKRVDGHLNSGHLVADDLSHSCGRW